MIQKGTDPNCIILYLCSMERTLVILKPCTIQRGLIGEVISRFEKRGLKLVAMKMEQLTPEILRQHYAHMVQKPFYPIIEKSMMAAPVVLCCWEGIDAVSVVREMAGATNGRKALPGTVRGDLCVTRRILSTHLTHLKQRKRSWSVSSVPATTATTPHRFLTTSTLRTSFEAEPSLLSPVVGDFDAGIVGLVECDVLLG